MDVEGARGIRGPTMDHLQVAEERQVGEVRI